MNKTVVINMVKQFARKLSDKEFLEYEDALMKIIRDQKTMRKIK